MTSTGRFLKATFEEGEIFLKNIQFKFPEEEVSLAKVKYPTHNGIQCFEVHTKSKEWSVEYLSFIDGYLLGFASGQSQPSRVKQTFSA